LLTNSQTKILRNQVERRGTTETTALPLLLQFLWGICRKAEHGVHDGLPDTRIGKERHYAHSFKLIRCSEDVHMINHTWTNSACVLNG
jgi:hypothetical protein